MTAIYKINEDLTIDVVSLGSEGAINYSQVLQSHPYAQDLFDALDKFGQTKYRHDVALIVGDSDRAHISLACTPETEGDEDFFKESFEIIKLAKLMVFSICAEFRPQVGINRAFVLVQD